MQKVYLYVAAKFNYLSRSINNFKGIRPYSALQALFEHLGLIPRSILRKLNEGELFQLGFCPMSQILILTKCPTLLNCKVQ